MLNHPTIDRLRDLGLVGMIHALEEQQRQPDSTQLTFEDRLAMLVDREVLEPDNKRLKTRLRFAGLRSETSGSVGIQLQALEPLPDALPDGSWVVLVGRTSAAEARAKDGQRELVAWLARLAPGRPGLRLVTVCSGALLAARAGLLAGRRATTAASAATTAVRSTRASARWHPYDARW